MNLNQKVSNLPIELIRKILIFRRPHPIALLFERSNFLENEFINGVKKSWSCRSPYNIAPYNSALNVWMSNRDISSYKKIV